MQRMKSRKYRLPLTAAILAAVTLLLAVLNLFLLHRVREYNFFSDMTTEGIYTMTDAMKKEMADVDEEVTITFCNDPDRLLSDELLRPTYILAKDLAAEKPNITVETLNLSRDAHAADQYKITAASSITSSDVIVSYAGKIRIASSDAFFSTGEDGSYYAYKGEYQLATMILSVTSILDPVAYFTVGHGESYYDAENPENADNETLLAFYELLVDIGLRVETLDLDALGNSGEIPADCVLLIMNAPDRDYDDSDTASYAHRSAIEKIDRYLEKRGSMLYFRDPDVPVSQLPTLHGYLEEWGIVYGDDILRGTRTGDMTNIELERLSAVYATNDTSAVSHAFYAAVADLVAAPRTVITRSSSLACAWRDTDEKTFAEGISRHVSPFLLAPKGTKSYDREGNLAGESDSFALAMVGVTAYFSEEANYTYSYLTAFGTNSILDADLLGSNAYGNRDILAAALRVMTRTDAYASSNLGSPTDLDSENYGGKAYESDDIVDSTTYYFVKGDDKLLSSMDIGNKTGYTLVRTMQPLSQTAAVFWTLLLMLLPIAVIPVAGIAMALRRKHL